MKERFVPLSLLLRDREKASQKYNRLQLLLAAAAYSLYGNKSTFEYAAGVKWYNAFVAEHPLEVPPSPETFFRSVIDGVLQYLDGYYVEGWLESEDRSLYD
jgi:hypothetical protein